VQSKTWKLLEKSIGKTWKNFWTNFNKIRRFLLIQYEFGSNGAADKHTNISVKIRISADIQKAKYRQIISVDRYIGRSLVKTSNHKIYKIAPTHKILPSLVTKINIIILSFSNSLHHKNSNEPEISPNYTCMSISDGSNRERVEWRLQAPFKKAPC